MYGLRKLVVGHYGARLHDLIERGASKEALHTWVGNLEANCGYECTFDGLVEEGHGTRCTDCDVDVMPHDEDGWPLEGRFERYMVQNHVWEAAKGEGWLCICCLEARLGRRLCAGDFKEGLPINEPDSLMSARLRGRLGAWEAVA
jgi:hypothetical protein